MLPDFINLENLTDDFLFDLGFDYSEDGNLVLNLVSADKNKFYEIFIYDNEFHFTFKTEIGENRIESSVCITINASKQLIALIEFCKA